MASDFAVADGIFRNWPAPERDEGSPMDFGFFETWRARVRGMRRYCPAWTQRHEQPSPTSGSRRDLSAELGLVGEVFIPPWAGRLIMRTTVRHDAFTLFVDARIGGALSASTLINGTGVLVNTPATIVWPASGEAPAAMLGTVQSFAWEYLETGLGFSFLRISNDGSDPVGQPRRQWYWEART